MGRTLVVLAPTTAFSSVKTILQTSHVTSAKGSRSCSVIQTQSVRLLIRLLPAMPSATAHYPYMYVFSLLLIWLMCLCPYAFSHSIPIHCSTEMSIKFMPVPLLSLLLAVPATPPATPPSHTTSGSRFRLLPNAQAQHSAQNVRTDTVQDQLDDFRSVLFDERLTLCVCVHITIRVHVCMEKPSHSRIIYKAAEDWTHVCSKLGRSYVAHLCKSIGNLCLYTGRINLTL